MFAVRASVRHKTDISELPVRRSGRQFIRALGAPFVKYVTQFVLYFARLNELTIDFDRCLSETHQFGIGAGRRSRCGQSGR